MDDSIEKITGTETNYFRYWGKARKEGKESGAPYHLLPYHCLDVAAVGQVLLRQHDGLRHSLAQLMGLSEDELIRSLPFFLALHDVGKFSASFQNLRADLFKTLQQRTRDQNNSPRHDNLGFMLWRHHLKEYFRQRGLLPKQNAGGFRARNQSTGLEYWIQAVTGHHGVPPKQEGSCSDYADTRSVVTAARL